MNKAQLKQVLQELQFDFSGVNVSSKRPASAKENIDLYTTFNAMYPDLCRSVSEFVYFSLHYKDLNFADSQFCYCGTRVAFDNRAKRYREYCSIKCMHKDPKLQQKKIQTCIKKYGCKNPLQSKAIREKIKETNLERYGTECPCTQGEALKKAKKTRLERYGTEQVTQNIEIKKKIKETNLERYGTECPVQNEQLQLKAKETLQKNFDVEVPLHSQKIKNKMRKTNLERYGVEYVSQNKEVASKMGAKIRKHFQETYGRNSNVQLNRSDKWMHTMSCAENLKAYIDKEQIKTTAELMKKLDISRASILEYLHKYDLYDCIDHYTSSQETELNSLFPNIFTKTRKPIYPYEIDLYSEDHKFGIEFNGSYWHSDKHIEDFKYHQKKSLLAEEKGIFLYHIWEYEWLNERKQSIILSQINNILGLNQNRIFARKCELKEVSAKEERSFLEENHIQGCSQSSIKFGLYYQNELVSLMTFGKPRFDKSCEYELIRFCNKQNTSVIGSASKLFKHFLKEYKPKSILSYSHIDKGTGKLYQKLGFELKSISDPGYVWVKGLEVLSRYQCQKHKLLKQGFMGNSEKEIMEGRGFIRVFDCGNKVWIYE